MAIGGSSHRGRGRARGARRYATFTEINITPLTDVVLVLLIIFMVTAQFINRADQGLNLNLPSASNVQDLNSLGGIRVSISPQGTYMVDGKPVAADQLSAELKRVAQSPQQMVIIEMDKASQGQSLVTVMDAALGAGMPNTCLATAAGAPTEVPTSVPGQTPVLPAPTVPAAPATPTAP